MIKEFYELEVWKIGKVCVIQIYKLTREFPKQETYDLVDQLRRAANSICANIAEGFDRYHTRDKIRFYYTARASISECKSHLLIAQELGYLSGEQVQVLLADLNSIGRLLNNMISSLNNLSRSRLSP